MKEQISFRNEVATLYLVSTPIGNLADMTYRAVQILQEVDYIFAEDTRVSIKLLNHYEIMSSLQSYHEFSNVQLDDKIISYLLDGKSVALISDAGTPCISDPGYELVGKVIKNDLNVVAIPGSNAILPALITSGLVVSPFTFIGFLPRKTSQMVNLLENYIERSETLVIYESPLRVKKTIEQLYQVLRNRRVSVARELTKKFESIIRSDLHSLQEYDFITKGEYVIVIEGDHTKKDYQHLTLNEHMQIYLDKGMTEKDAMKMVAKD